MANSSYDSRNLPLDLLRGTCAFAIAIYHYLAWTNAVTIQSMGTFGVYTFFVISGAVMMMTYARRFGTSIDKDGLADFYWKRLSRILPLLILVSVYGYFTFGNKPVSNLLLTGSGLFALHMPGKLGVTPGVWSLGIELAFYAIFPVICLLAVGCRIRSLLIVFAILVAAQQVMLTTLPPTSDLLAFWEQYTLPLTFAPFFAGGILAYRLALPASYTNTILATCAIMAIFTFSLVVEIDLFTGGIAYVALTILAIGSVVFARYSLLPRMLYPASWFAGEISYSLYLTHWKAYDIVIGLDPSIRWAAFIVVSIVLASAVTFLFERPVKNYLRRKLDKRAASAHDAAAATSQP